jgi:RNA polymerase sigma-70 factor, ECF subfamily
LHLECSGNVEVNKLTSTYFGHPSETRQVRGSSPSSRSHHSESDAWIVALRGTGVNRDKAHTQLFEYLLQCARKEAGRAGSWASFAGPELDDLATEAASDALVAILAKLGEFRGDSLFTTWSYCFVKCEVRSKVARHFWKRGSQSLEEINPEHLIASPGYEPHVAAEAAELTARVWIGIQSLTEKQRVVLIAVAIQQKGVDEVAREIGMNRNALYKALFDARQRLRKALELDGILVPAHR